MSRFAKFRRALIVSSLVMLAGIGMLIISAAAPGRVPLSWTKIAALFVIGGAVAELGAVWRFMRWSKRAQMNERRFPPTSA